MPYPLVPRVFLFPTLFPLARLHCRSELIPLHIFEQRYRVIITMLRDEREFRGSCGSPTTRLRGSSCACEIAEYEPHGRRRMNLVGRGAPRPFRGSASRFHLAYPARACRPSSSRGGGVGGGGGGGRGGGVGGGGGGGAIARGDSTRTSHKPPRFPYADLVGRQRTATDPTSRSSSSWHAYAMAARSNFRPRPPSRGLSVFAPYPRCCGSCTPACSERYQALDFSTAHRPRARPLQGRVRLRFSPTSRKAPGTACTRNSSARANSRVMACVRAVSLQRRRPVPSSQG